MKLKKKVICIVAIVICMLILLGTFLIIQSGPKASEIPFHTEKDVGDENAFKKVKDNEVSIENEQIIFTLDSATTHFTVQNKENGDIYHSVADVGDEQAGFYQSELVLDYFDSNSMLQTMYSRENSVEFDTFEVEAKEDAIRVKYDIRKNKEDLFVPSVFTQDVFEEEVLGKLATGKARRMKMYYKLRTSEDKEFLEDYPELKNQNLYIVSEELNTNDYLEVTYFCEEIGYTREHYAEDSEGLDIKTVDVESSAQFLIPVEYRLTEDGFTAEILTEKIESKSTNCTLTEIHLLPCYGSTTEQTEGYLFVPDGSGGIMSFEEQKDAVYLQSVYGADMAIDGQQKSQLTKRVALPVFGMNRGSNGTFGIIENAAECATVCGQVQGSTNKSNNVYVKFMIQSYDASDSEISQVSGRTAFNLYAKDRISENPKVKYVLLDQDACDYSAMARYYQKYLVDKGVLGERLTEDDSVLYLDFTGYLSQKATLLGVSYDKKIVFSTLDEMKKVITSLNEDGISGINVRLKAYSHGGINNTIMDSFEITSNVGSKDELIELSKYLKEQGGMLYLDHVADKVYKDGMTDHFQKFTHAARKVNRMLVIRNEKDLVLKNDKKTFNQHFYLSPKFYPSMVMSFMESAEESLGNLSDYGYSWADYGYCLSGDYSNEANVDRIQARKLSEQAIMSADKFGSILTDGGNIYATAFANTLLNVPLTGSDYQSITSSVPFYQMVLHGYRNLAGAPLNEVADGETEWLNTVEGGTSMYYSCMTEDSSMIKNMEYRQQLYPISESLNHEEMVNRYETYGSIFKKLATQTICKHEIAENGLRLTTYEDGTVVIVNYNREPLTIEGITVDARSFAVK